MAKVIKVSLDVAVDDSVTEEDIAAIIEGALKPHAAKATALGSLQIHTPERDGRANSNDVQWLKTIWQKATC